MYGTHKHQPYAFRSPSNNPQYLDGQQNFKCAKCLRKDTYHALSNIDDCEVPDEKDLPEIEAEQERERQRAIDFLSSPVSRHDTAGDAERKRAYQRANNPNNQSQSSDNSQPGEGGSIEVIMPPPTPFLERVFRLGVAFLILTPFFLTVHFVLGSFDEKFANLIPLDFGGYLWTWAEVKLATEFIFDGSALATYGLFLLLPR